MRSSDLLVDAFERVTDAVHRAVDGLSGEDLVHRVDEESNTVAWLVWHLARVQDDHVAEVAGLEQVWTAQGWVDRFGLRLDPDDTGYGHGPDEVDAVRVDSAELLTGYLDAVHEQSVGYLQGLTDDALDRVVDERWDPAVTLGVRLVSVIADDLQHAGQAAFLRGLLLRRRDS